MISLTDGATRLIISASCEVKLRKSVRYATRSSREFLISTRSTSCVKMTGHFEISGCSEDTAVDSRSRSESVSVLAWNGEDAEEVLSGEDVREVRAECGHIFSRVEGLELWTCVPNISRCETR